MGFVFVFKFYWLLDFLEDIDEYSNDGFVGNFGDDFSS